MIKFLLFATSFSLTTLMTFAQRNEIIRPDGSRITFDNIDKKIQQLMEGAGVTGLAVGIIQDNKPALIKSYGYKNKTLHRPGTVNTSLYAASFTKSLFAYLVMQLVDQKRIDLDKPLYQYLPKPLPEYTGYQDLQRDDRWKLITARHCLSHTTGFPNWRFLNPNGSKKLEFFFIPGSRYAYSGEGLYLLQMVIEVITGRGLEELAREHVFNPLGMTRSGFIWQPVFDSDYANGHSVDEDSFAVKKRSEANAGGSMQTTITDYTNFIAAVLRGYGLSEAAKREMLSPQIAINSKKQFPSLNNDTTDQYRSIQLSYGLGWGLFNTGTYGRAFFKEGHSDDGWEHYLIALPEKKTALVIMGNSMNSESIYKELVAAVMGVTIPWEWEGYPPYKPAVKLSGSLLQKYTGSYTGKFKAIFLVESEQLKVESADAGLAKTAVYATSEDHFFMRSLPVTLEFLKNSKGEVQKVKVDDGEEKYELTKQPDTATKGE
jgi:CubicO group peptidase (beta-lactamase class C family)